ncbi:MAG: hypothetical protein ACI92O_001854 [Colwellia sp.]|jgi:hypothetical protein
MWILVHILTLLKMQTQTIALTLTYTNKRMNEYD